MSNFPHEIIVEILWRLPVKSLCRFKCVSKPWRLLISDPSFVKTHLNLNQAQKPKLILAGKYLYSLDLEQFDNGNGEIKSIELDYPTKSNTDSYWSNFFGSCNGLMCIMPQPNIICIYNPCIGEFKIIALNSADDNPSFPDTPAVNCITLYPMYAPILYGFGYAPSVDDYRFVKISNGVVAVYSLRTGSSAGRRGRKFPYNAPDVGYVSGTSLNGAIHWLVSHKKTHNYVIAAFDLAAGKFRDLPLPGELTDATAAAAADFRKFTIGVLDGCICLMHLNASTSHNEFWMMKEYGVMESWIKIKITFSYHVLNPMCLVKNDCEALLGIDQRRLVLCNLANGMCEDVVFQAFPPNLLNSAVYVESLVSPYPSNVV